MFKRLTAQTALLALVAGVLTVAAAPAALSATPSEVHSLMPNSNYPESDQMSDASDGTTIYDGAHFSAVADPEATQVSWYLCPVGTASASSKPANNCDLLGTDTSGIQPLSSGEEGYDIAVDFTSSQDGTRDIMLQACDGTPEASTGPAVPANCVQDVESGIDIDDAGSGGREYPTGELTATCEAGGCATPAGYTAGATNGEVFPEGVVGFAVYTNPEVSDATVCLDVDPDFETLACDVYASGGIFPFETTETFKRGAAFVPVPADSEFVYITYGVQEGESCGTAVFVGSDPSLSGDDSTACVFAMAYGMSTDEDPARAEAAFQTTGSTCREPGDLAERRPASPDEDAISGLGVEHVVEGCLQEAGDTYISDVQATFDSSGAGSLTCTTGTASDTDGDGDTDRCTLSAASTGDLYEVGIANAAGPGGDQSITFCADADGDGCADELAVDTVVMHWQTTAPKQCADGADNDGDGKVDGDDLGCTDSNDDTENSDVQLVDAPSTVTIKYVKAKKLFKGTVGSGAPACVTGRKVIVKKVGAGKIGTANASSTGVWKLKKAQKRGKFFAVVKQLETSTIRCLAKKSATIKI